VALGTLERKETITSSNVVKNILISKSFKNVHSEIEKATECQR
jgi:hypothetical protein